MKIKKEKGKVPVVVGLSNGKKILFIWKSKRIFRKRVLCVIGPADVYDGADLGEIGFCCEVAIGPDKDGGEMRILPVKCGRKSVTGGMVWTNIGSIFWWPITQASFFENHKFDEVYISL